MFGDGCQNSLDVRLPAFAVFEFGSLLETFWELSTVQQFPSPLENMIQHFFREPACERILLARMERSQQN